ncbi:MAG: hypothetical protein EP318_04570 [Rhodobacteraceae bacterium]|nr:MAG: hypothetical protein EP318_04570 [Paracoccaceae bacterium]
MIRRTLSLAKLSPDSLRAIEDGLRAIGADIRAMEFDARTAELMVEVETEAAAEQVETFVEGMRRTHRLVARKVLGAHRGARGAGCTDAELAACGDLHFIDDGLTAINGTLLKLFRFFERTFKGFADDFGAEEQHYPVMVPTRLLQDVGYFGNFPQHVTLCSHFPDSLPVLETVSSTAQAAQDPPTGCFAEHAAAPGHVLTPAVCLPCYSQHRDLELAPGAVKVLTMQNHVFRYEANRFAPLSRGWDFSVRDIVFFGSHADLVRLRSEVMEKVMALCAALDLEVTLELANDPFFLDTGRDKIVYQRMGEVKYELLFNIPHRVDPLAVSSFNLHRDFYTSVYNTRQGAGLADSACMGFGLERWLYGFVTQKGLDPAGWPEMARQGISAG